MQPSPEHLSITIQLDHWACRVSSCCIIAHRHTSIHYVTTCTHTPSALGARHLNTGRRVGCEQFLASHDCYGAPWNDSTGLGKADRPTATDRSRVLVPGPQLRYCTGPTPKHPSGTTGTTCSSRSQRRARPSTHRPGALPPYGRPRNESTGHDRLLRACSC